MHNATVIYFLHADWCGPCKRTEPEVDEFNTENESVKIEKYNIDENIEMAKKYKINSIPTLIYFKDGEEKTRHGSCAKHEIYETIKNI